MKYILIAMLALPSPIWAADPTCKVQDYTDPGLEPDYSCPSPGEDALVPVLSLKTSVVLKETTPAPWEGILLDTNRLLTLGLRIKALRRIRWQERIHCEDRVNAEVEFTESRNRATINLRTTQIGFYRKKTQALQNEVTHLKKWYRSGPFWFSVGVATAAAGTLATVLAVR